MPHSSQVKTHNARARLGLGRTVRESESRSRQAKTPTGTSAWPSSNDNGSPAVGVHFPFHRLRSLTLALIFALS